MDLSSLSKCDLLSINIDESDMDVQQSFYSELNYLIDSILDIRYKENKSSFAFYDIASVNAFIRNNIDSLNYVCTRLYDFVGHIVSYQSIMSDLRQLDTGSESLSLSDTSFFCNKILNLHKDYFYRENRKIIYKDLSSKIDVSDRVKKSLFNSVRIKKVINLLSDSIYLKSNKYISEVKRFKKYICKNDILSSYFDVFFNNFSSFIDYYRNGCLDIDHVRGITGIDDSDVLNLFIKKFNKFILNLSNCVILSDIDKSSIDYSNIPFNYNNFKIFDRKRYINSIRYISSLCGLNHFFNKCDDILFLVSFVGLFDELDFELCSNLINNYDYICRHIDGSICKNFFSIYYSCDEFSSRNKMSMYALGKNVSDCIKISDSFNYLDFYMKMIKKYGCYIPSVSFYKSDYLYESGCFSDLDRLLIGKKAGTYSCIQIGSPTFDDVLLSFNNDVVLVKDSNGIKYRIFLFRKGNVVQMATNFKTPFSIDVYEEICRQIILNSSGDIKFVFVNTSSCSNKHVNYPIVHDSRFIDKFPYSDLFIDSIMLYGDDYNLANYDESNYNLYPKKRMPINYNGSIDDVIRLEAFNLILNNNYDISLLDKFNYYSYKSIICGEDWYIIVFDDCSYSEFFLDIACDQSRCELEGVKKRLFTSKGLVLK